MRLAVFLLFMTLTIGALQGAEAQGLCRNLFRSTHEWGRLINLRRMDDVLTPEFSQDLLTRLRAQSQALRENVGGAPLEERDRRLFDAYLELRLRPLSTKQNEDVRRFLANRVRFVINRRPDLLAKSARPGTIGGCFAGSEIQILLPKDLAGTIFDYVIRSHEFEHLIQEQTPSWKDRGVLHPLHFAELFEREMGAIVAESFLLLATPKSELRELRARLLEAKIPDLDKEIAGGILDDAITAESPEAYLRAQWKRGRYSRWTFLKKQARTYFAVGSLTGLGYWALTAVFGSPF